MNYKAKYAFVYFVAHLAALLGHTLKMPNIEYCFCIVAALCFMEVLK